MGNIKSFCGIKQENNTETYPNLGDFTDMAYDAFHKQAVFNVVNFTISMLEFRLCLVYTTSVSHFDLQDFQFCQ
jgi:hypothetical protein